jgi:hypothetical protein
MQSTTNPQLFNMPIGCTVCLILGNPICLFKARGQTGQARTLADECRLTVHLPGASP